MQTSRDSLVQTPESEPRTFRFPAVESLGAGLNAALKSIGYTRGPVNILAREAVGWSTYPSEIVTCRLGDGTVLRLRCKYSAGLTPEGHGHRGGVPYEAKVYCHVLQPIGFSTPDFYGLHEDAVGHTWLFVEDLDGGLRLGKGPRPQAHLQAANWLGRFHACNERRVSSDELSFLNRYDAEYYLGWVRRTSEYAGGLHERFPWLRILCERAGQFIAPLLSAPQTVIHGEFYGKNVLYRRGMIHPVDWESAAIAAGEIDLASMTEGWDEEIVRMCKLEYGRARRSKRPAPGFERTFGAARLYLLFRWMGDRPEWTSDVENIDCFEDMRSIGEKVGLL